MQNPLNKVFEKEMDRKEFITHVGAGLVAVAGVSTIIKAFTGEKGGSSQNGGYGGGSYGGR